MSIPAIMLAAGKGTRLRPLTDQIPKCMVPIMGRPLLDFWVTACHKAGFGPIIINTHYLADQVEQYVRQSPLSKSVVLVHEKELLGTGGTILALKKLLHGTFFVAHSDNLSVFDMANFLTAHANRPQGCLMTMLLFETPTPESCGIVSLDNQGVVQEFHEKVPGIKETSANGAVYLMEPEVLPLLENCGTENPDISLDLVPQCLGQIFTFKDVAYHRDIGTVKSYTVAQKEFAALQSPHNDLESSGYLQK